MSQAVPSSHHASRIGLLQVAMGGVLWGTGGLAVQLIRRHSSLSVLTISAYRTLTAAVFLVIAVFAQRQWSVMRQTARRHPVALVTAGVGTAAYQVMYFIAVANVGVSVATVVSLGLAPVVLTVSSSITSRQRPSTHSVQVVVLAVTGLVLISFLGANHASGPHPVAGLIAALGSGSTYAATVTVAGPLAERNAPLLVTAGSSVVGAVALVPIAAFSSGGTGLEVGHHPGAWLGLVYLGAFTMALAYALFYSGLRTTPQSSAVVATLLEPVTAVIAAALILGERLNAGAAIGTVMILGAVVLLWARSPRAPLPVAPGV